MSFKRDGDDFSLLNKLRHQRISELLGTHIPEDEAKLLSNGRLTCLICNHRPIFDTMSMLARHRQRSKHLLELNKFIKRNEQIELQKIKQEIYLENCRKAEIAEIRSNTKLLGPKNNFPCCSTNESTIGTRRKIIDIPKIHPIKPSNCDAQITARSSSSQLRKYIRNIKKKPQLENLLEREKSSYSTRDVPNETDVHCVPAEIEKRKIIDSSAASQLKADLSRNLSGWIKDKSGNWIKDPEAEFDTDDDELPNLNTN